MMVKLWPYLRLRRRIQFGLVLGLMLVSACLEVVSLGAVIPFIGILTEPEKVFNYSLVADNAHIVGANVPSDLVLPLTIVFCMLAIIAGGVRLLVLWFNTRLAFTTGAELSSEIYRRTLYQPYQTHIARNSGEVISGIVNKTSAVVHGVLYPLLLLISSFVIMGVILLTLIIVNPMAAMTVIAGFGFVYGVIVWGVRRKLHRNSLRVAKEQTQVIKALQEGLGGVRDVLLDGSQSVYSKAFESANQPLQHALGNNVFLVASPRFLIEAIGIIAIASLAYSLSLAPGGVVAALPVLAMLVLAAQRLLPVMQQSYASWTTILASSASLVDVLKLLDQPLPVSLGSNDMDFSGLLLEKEIVFDNVCFSYDGNSPWVINEANFTVPVGSRVALVGATGSGKSTIVDLFMGLLEPTSGHIFLDGNSLSCDLLSAWQKVIAHVPQEIFLADATIAENIAFGVPKKLVDMKQVQLAAERAQLSEFIMGRLGGYESMVGEKGVQLSGGQRQRIGIARALYKNASVLVFDEATSALDNLTEQAVMRAIDTLDRNVTVLVVAHRLSTIEHCDVIIEFDHGKIVAKGNYQQLLECSPSFRRMANKYHSVSHT